MSLLDAVSRAAAADSGERPHFLEHPDCDRLLSMLLASAGQLAALHERLDTLERVLQREGLLKAEALDSYEPDDEVQAARMEWDEAFVRRLFRVLSTDVEALKRRPPG